MSGSDTSWLAQQLTLCEAKRRSSPQGSLKHTKSHITCVDMSKYYTVPCQLSGRFASESGSFEPVALALRELLETLHGPFALTFWSPKCRACLGLFLLIFASILYILQYYMIFLPAWLRLDIQYPSLFAQNWLIAFRSYHQINSSICIQVQECILRDFGGTLTLDSSQENCLVITVNVSKYC